MAKKGEKAGYCHDVKKTQDFSYEFSSEVNGKGKFCHYFHLNSSHLSNFSITGPYPPPVTAERSSTLPRVSSTRSRGVAPVLSTTGLIFENRPRYSHLIVKTFN